MWIHEEDREKCRAAFARLRCSDALELEYRIVRRDGEVRHVRKNSFMEADQKTGRIIIFGILQDVTGLREQRAALEYREALAQQAEAITEIGHFIYNEQLAVYKYVSPGLSRILGMSPQQYLENIKTTEGDLEDIHPEDRPHVKQVYDQNDEGGEAYSVEYLIYRPDGEIRWVRERCVTHAKKNGEILESLGVLQDITREKEAAYGLLQAQKRLESTVAQLQDEIAKKEKIEAELEFLANHDSLTSLPSLRLCMDRLERSIAEAKRNWHNVYVMFIDLDGFKQVNDRYGHDCGDEVLKVTAQRILGEIRESDTAARIGGDEFLVILSGLMKRRDVDAIAANLVAAISKRYPRRG